MKIIGIENLSASELDLEIQRGGKFVVYQYCVSVLVITFRRSSDIYFIKPAESAVQRGLPWTLLTLVAGWWGIPWGPIFSIQALVTNLKGGKDVTAQVRTSLTPKPAAPKPAPSAAATSGQLV
jgi:hypothetical protein